MLFSWFAKSLSLSCCSCFCKVLVLVRVADDSSFMIFSEAIWSCCLHDSRRLIVFIKLEVEIHSKSFRDAVSFNAAAKKVVVMLITYQFAPGIIERSRKARQQSHRIEQKNDAR